MQYDTALRAYTSKRVEEIESAFIPWKTGARYGE